jgi:hypothetical protein
MTSVCPKCRDILATDARACACGWRMAPMQAESAPTRPVKPGSSWRERWYAERGLPYEPPPIKDVPGWQCVGRVKLRMREPGEDSAEDIGEEATG